VLTELELEECETEVQLTDLGLTDTVSAPGSRKIVVKNFSS
jgi:hypothetical protein